MTLEPNSYTAGPGELRSDYDGEDQAAEIEAENAWLRHAERKTNDDEGFERWEEDMGLLDPPIAGPWATIDGKVIIPKGAENGQTFSVLFNLLKSIEVMREATEEYKVHADINKHWKMGKINAYDSVIKEIERRIVVTSTTETGP